MIFSLNRWFLVLAVLFVFNNAYTQSIPVGTIGDEYLRILQLEGKIDPRLSLTTRPNFLDPKFGRDSFYSYLYLF